MNILDDSALFLLGSDRFGLVLEASQRNSNEEQRDDIPRPTGKMSARKDGPDDRRSGRRGGLARPPQDAAGEFGDQLQRRLRPSRCGLCLTPGNSATSTGQ